MSVSILMNCYNSEKYLAHTLDSLFSQTYEDWELIFIDNHSTDKSIEILDSYLRKEKGNKDRVSLIQTPEHMALGAARDYGIQFCKRDFICFLDTDDIWMADKLERQLEAFQHYQEATLCYSSYDFIDEDGVVFKKKRFKHRVGQLFGVNLANYEINFQTAMIKRIALSKIDKPYFDLQLQYSPDYNLMMKVLANGPAICLSESLVQYRKSKNSLTHKLISRWCVESEITYQQLEEMGALVYSTEQQQRAARAKIEYYKARYLISINHYKEARLALSKYKGSSVRYFIIYVLAYVPWLWRYLHQGR
ncbi:hypothetical protein BHU72_05335 [Desulfuribacillus stibiiarsenatis]|uniref:Glycosyltransferase 2-like domain-containing protein n=1 Tax=Desulfuribacillus stibiiarsenatis TaxID=1390249 RepID=A0A1E5L693_9FIRM|nr:glycosyltransferase [Desulfuribacillus stibiiarsenatis]OEH85509.1 hypothetical protein BHU72_05335 [Desulfuribacillus stibiiarsenatis]